MSSSKTTTILEGTPSSHSLEKTVVKRTELILSELTRQPIFRALDAGCGMGVYLDVLASGSQKVVGVDINPNFLSQVRAGIDHEGVELVCASLEALGLETGSVDFLMSVEVLEHVPNDNAAVSEFTRLLGEGGRLVISVPYKWFFFETHGIQIGKKVYPSPFGLGFPLLTFLPDRLRDKFATARVYSKRKLLKMMSAHGIQVEKVCFMMPGMDIFERKVKSRFLAQAIRFVFDWMEKLLAGVWGSTIVIIGRV